jgi:hypothetical protein
MLICEDEGTVNAVATVGKEPVLKEVSDVEVLCDSTGVIISVPIVLPLTVEEEWVLCGDVDVETDIHLVVLFDEDKAFDSD